MKWLEAGKDIGNTGKVGECPHCKGLNTDYSFVIVNEKDRMGYLDIWCNDCKKLGHFSRVKVPKETIKAISIDNIDNIIPKYEVTY